MRKSAGDKKEKLSKEQEEAELRRKIDTDPDFIYAPAYGNSMKELIRRRGPDGINEKKIAQVLKLTEEEVELEYQSAIMKVRESLHLNEDDLHRDQKTIEREEAARKILDKRKT
jgi:hypothetical protein